MANYNYKLYNIISTQGRIQESALGGLSPSLCPSSSPFLAPFPSLPFPLPFFPVPSFSLPSHPIPFPSFPSPPLRSRPPVLRLGVWGSAQAPKRVRAEPGRQTVFGEL